MKITIEKLGYDETQVKLRLESENQTESAELVVLGKRIKKQIPTWGLIGKERTILDIRIPVRRQKVRDDEFGNFE